MDIINDNPRLANFNVNSTWNWDSITNLLGDTFNLPYGNLGQINPESNNVRV